MLEMVSEIKIKLVARGRTLLSRVLKEYGLKVCNGSRRLGSQCWALVKS